MSYNTTPPSTLPDPVTVIHGGSGLATVNQGDILAASAANTLSAIPANATAGKFLRNAGTSTIPDWSTLVLPNAATQGDILTSTASNTIGVVAAVAAGSILASNGTSAVPVYTATPSITDITLSGAVKIAAGTAANPSLRLSADPDTGIYSSGANTLDIATGGSLVAEFTGGSATPQFSLTSTDATTFALATLANNAGQLLQIITYGSNRHSIADRFGVNSNNLTVMQGNGSGAFAIGNVGSVPVYVFTNDTLRTTWAGASGDILHTANLQVNGTGIGVGIAPSFALHIEKAGDQTTVVRTSGVSNIATVNASNTDGTAVQMFCYGASGVGSLLGVTTAGRAYLAGGSSATGLALGSTAAIPITLATNNILRATWNGTTGNLTFVNRVENNFGATVSSAGSMTLGNDGNAFFISGTTSINNMETSNWQAGSIVTLMPTGNLTVQHKAGASGSLKDFSLTGSVNFSMTNNSSTLTVLFDGALWREIGRCV